MQQLKGYFKAIIDTIIRLSKFNLKDRWIELVFVFKKFLDQKTDKYHPIDRQMLREYNKSK